MAGKLIAGDDPTTRGNIARSVIRNTMNKFSGQFNWGLETFYIGGAGLYSTIRTGLATHQTMVFTDDCVNGISASNAGLRCIANPQWHGRVSAITTLPTTGRATTPTSTTCSISATSEPERGRRRRAAAAINFYFTHNPGTAFEANMANYWTTFGFTPTDAGYIPFNPPISRQLYAFRAWGFYAGVNGTASIHEPVASSGTPTHSQSSWRCLAPKRNTGPTSRTRPYSLRWPGSMLTANQYFSGGAGSRRRSRWRASELRPARHRRQPDVRLSGNMYPLSSQQKPITTRRSDLDLFKAASDVLPQISSCATCRSRQCRARHPDLCRRLGDTVANPGSVATLNQFASTGGTNVAYLAHDAIVLGQCVPVDCRRHRIEDGRGVRSVAQHRIMGHRHQPVPGTFQ